MNKAQPNAPPPNWPEYAKHLLHLALQKHPSERTVGDSRLMMFFAEQRQFKTVREVWGSEWITKTGKPKNAAIEMNMNQLHNSETLEQVQGRIARLCVDPTNEPPEELSEDQKRYFKDLQQAMQSRRELDAEMRSIRQGGNKALLSEIRERFGVAQQAEGKATALLNESLRTYWNQLQQQHRTRVDLVASAEQMLNAHYQAVREDQRARELEIDAENIRARSRNVLREARTKLETKAAKARIEVSAALDLAEQYTIPVGPLRPHFEVSTNA